MPKGFEEPTPSNTGAGGDFLRLPKDKDSALVVLTDLPMLMLMHRLDPEGERSLGDRLLCGIPEGLGCPVCEKPQEYSEKVRGTNGVGFYPFWVESQSIDGRNETVKKHMVFEGTYSFAKPFKFKKQLAEQDGESIEGSPYRITRLGEKMQTTYAFDAAPKAKVSVEDAPDDWDIEKFAIRLLRADQKKLGYGPDQEMEAKIDAGHDPFEGNGTGMSTEEFKAATTTVQQKPAPQAQGSEPAGEAEDDGMYGVDPNDPIATSKVALAMAYEEAQLGTPMKQKAFWKAARMKVPETEDEIDAALLVLETRIKGLAANAKK